MLGGWRWCAPPCRRARRRRLSRFLTAATSWSDADGTLAPTPAKLQPTLIDAPMCGAFCCAGAPSALSCTKQRVDIYEQPLCELCGRRLRTVKNTHPHGPGRACHPRCKPSKHAVDGIESISAVAVRSHKRAPTDPGKQQPAPAVLIAPPPLLTPAKATPTRLHDRNSWTEQGWKMIRGNRARVTMMKDWH